MDTDACMDTEGGWRTYKYVHPITLQSAIPVRFIAKTQEQVLEL